VEGTVIVGSILLAFGIEAGWARMQERSLAADYVARVERDLQVDTSRWGEDEVLIRKGVALDEAWVWLKDPDFAAPAVERFLANLTFGAQRAYGLGINAERSAFDELVSTGHFQLLDAELREALLRYHKSVDFARDRITARESTYAAKVYELTPRDAVSNVAMRAGLTNAELERIARRAVDADLEGPLVAERNQGELRQVVIRQLFVEATDLLDLIRMGGAF
jgi:hypothetical protein